MSEAGFDRLNEGARLLIWGALRARRCDVARHLTCNANTGSLLAVTA